MFNNIFQSIIAINNLSNDKILLITQDYFRDGCSKTEAKNNLISDGFSELESNLSVNIVYPDNIEETTNNSIIKSIEHNGEQIHWCPKNQTMIEKSICDTIKCAHLKGCGQNHVKCSYWKTINQDNIN